ncbi:MAG: hypothetical protein KJZ77_19075 [Anaerolineales bacterium]|nr:hypothetical protein [Anaerolineales bacterium]
MYRLKPLQVNLLLIPEEKNITYRDDHGNIYKIVDKLEDKYLEILQNHQTPQVITLTLEEREVAITQHSTCLQSHGYCAIDSNTFSKAPFSDEERIYLVPHARVLKKDQTSGHYVDIFGNEVVVEGMDLPDTLTLTPFNAIFKGDNKRIYLRINRTHFKLLR